MNNIVQTKRTPVAGRRPTGLMAGELYFNFADRTIGCVDENGNPVDIATAIAVSATPPASPVPGLLWYRTAIPAGLYIWFVDADSSQWVQVAGGGSGGGGGGSGGGGGASVEVGPVPPEAPADGQFWFSTVEPVGLFIWLIDEDSAQWVQVGGSSSPVGGVPIGTVSYFAANSPPPGWLTCNNQRVTTAYPELRQYLIDAGSPYGLSGSDPRVPELRGEFIRGASLGRSDVDAGRVFGSTQLDQMQRITGNLNDVQTLGGAAQTGGVVRRNATTSSAIWQGATAVNRNTRFDIDTLLDPTVRSGDETRPRNVALLPCIKAFDTLTVEGSAEFNIATPEQAVEGTSTDTLMTPALVQARGGLQAFALDGLMSVTFNEVPNEANEIDLLLNGAAISANAVLSFDFSGAVAARAFSSRILHGSIYSPPVGDDNNTIFVLDNPTNAQFVTGLIRLVRNWRGGSWHITGSQRRSPASLMVYGGAFNMNNEQNAFLRLNSTIAFTTGSAAARWRI